jgi:hypothetical protein
MSIPLAFAGAAQARAERTLLSAAFDLALVYELKVGAPFLASFARKPALSEVEGWDSLSPLPLEFWFSKPFASTAFASLRKAPCQFCAGEALSPAFFGESFIICAISC